MPAADKEASGSLLPSAETVLVIGDQMKARVKRKRHNRGLQAENSPRQKRITRQFFLYATATAFTRTLLAPLERLQITF